MDASAMVAFDVALHRDDEDWLEDRDTAVPADDKCGRIYSVPEPMIEHFKHLGPLNMSNAGVGETSARKRRA